MLRSTHSTSLQVLLTLDDIIPNVVFIQYDVRAPDKYLTIDAAALVNLELLENNDTYTSQGTLLEVLDHCVTPMGTLSSHSMFLTDYPKLTLFPLHVNTLFPRENLFILFGGYLVLVSEELEIPK